MSSQHQAVLCSAFWRKFVSLKLKCLAHRRIQRKAWVAAIWEKHSSLLALKLCYHFTVSWPSKLRDLYLKNSAEVLIHIFPVSKFVIWMLSHVSSCDSKRWATLKSLTKFFHFAANLPFLRVLQWYNYSLGPLADCTDWTVLVLILII